MKERYEKIPTFLSIFNLDIQNIPVTFYDNLQNQYDLKEK